MKNDKIKYLIVGGADNGNGTFKGAFSVVEDDVAVGVNYYEKQNVQSSTTSEIDTSDWNLEKVFSLAGDLITEEVKIEKRLGIEIESTVKNFIGDSAMNRNETLDELDITDDEGKLRSELSIRGTSAYIGAEAIKHMATKIKEEKGNFEISDLDKIKEIEIDVKLATALPVSVYSQEVGNKLANKFREKPYEFAILLPKRRKCNIKINYIKVAVEAEAKATTRFFENANEKLFSEYNEKAKEFNATAEGKKHLMPKIDKSFFANKENTIFHVDIGEGTSELVFTNGNDWKVEISEGIKNGIGRASIDAVKALKGVHGTEHLKSQKVISKILKEKDDRFFDVVAEKAIQPLSKQAQEITTAVKRKLQSNVPNLLVVYGGGSILLKEFIIEELERVARDSRTPLLYVPATYSVKLNALGLYSYAKSEDFKESILE